MIFFFFFYLSNSRVSKSRQKPHIENCMVPKSPFKKDLVPIKNHRYFVTMSFCSVRDTSIGESFPKAACKVMGISMEQIDMFMFILTHAKHP